MLILLTLFYITDKDSSEYRSNIELELSKKDSIIQVRELRIKEVLYEMDSLKRQGLSYNIYYDSIVNQNNKIKDDYKRNKKNMSNVIIFSNDSIANYISNVLQNWE